MISQEMHHEQAASTANAQSPSQWQRVDKGGHHLAGPRLVDVARLFPNASICSLNLSLHITCPYGLKDFADAVIELRRRQQMDMIGHPNKSMDCEAMLPYLFNHHAAKN
jgi:hypothetical protein